MKIYKQGDRKRYCITLTPEETQSWADSNWPNSRLAGHEVVVEVDTNGLVDYSGPELDDQAELVAIVSDQLNILHNADLRHLWPIMEKR